jgi:hypothetical protein
MKKALLLFASILFLGNVFSQGVKLGLNFNPGFLINRVTDPKETGDTLTYHKKGLGMKFTAGPDLHIMFHDNYGMTLGLWYAAKRAGVRTKDKDTGEERIDSYNLQYVQIPLTLRMYTNEIATDMKLYFQVGGTFDIKLASKIKKLGIEDDPIIRKFGRFDATVLAGAGVELQMGSATYLMGGIRYQRSLIDNASKYDAGIAPFKLNSDFMSLDIGIKF